MAMRNALFTATVVALIRGSFAEPNPKESVTVDGNAYDHVSCWSQRNGVPALSGRAVTVSDLTVEKCASLCSGTKFMALAAGKKCYCGDHVQASSSAIDESACTTPCAGDRTEQCGSSTAWTLYALSGNAPGEATGSVKETVDNYSHVSCWTDLNGGSRERALSGIGFASSSMSVDVCADFCSGFEYFGVGNGRECYCAESTAASSGPADESQCDANCEGDPSQICGAAGRLNLYKQGDVPSESAESSLPASPSSSSSVIASSVIIASSEIPSEIPSSVFLSSPSEASPLPSSVASSEAVVPSSLPGPISSSVIISEVSSSAIPSEVISGSSVSAAESSAVEAISSSALPEITSIISSIDIETPSVVPSVISSEILPPTPSADISSSAAIIASSDIISSSVLPEISSVVPSIVSSEIPEPIPSSDISSSAAGVISSDIVSSSALPEISSVISSAGDISSQTPSMVPSISVEVSSSAAPVISSGVTSEVASISVVRSIASSDVASPLPSGPVDISSSIAPVASSDLIFSSVLPEQSSFLSSPAASEPSSIIIIIESSIVNTSSAPSSIPSEASSTPVVVISSTAVLSSVISEIPSATSSVISSVVPEVSSIVASPVESSTSAPTPTGYEYVSCWKEPSSGRALTGAFTASDDMTLELCGEFCTGWPYFGVEYGRECFCGSAPVTRSSAAQESDCNMPCAGDDAQTCGSGSRLSLYHTTSSTGPQHPATVDNYEYFGCVLEARNGGRSLGGAATASDDMTLEKCAAFCGQRGSTFFGTEYSRECFCGNEFRDGTVQIEDGECDMTCSGNRRQWCGAGDRLSVYKLAA